MPLAAILEMPALHVEFLLAHFAQPTVPPTQETPPMARMHSTAAPAVAYPAFLDRLCED